MTEVPDKKTFETLYAGQAPWDIGKPQKPFLDVADQISGSVLDAGCGTGDTALFLAGRGGKVTGIDFLEEPIKRAKRKAAERGLSATFRPDTQGMGRAVRQRDRQRPVSRLLRRGPEEVRCRPGDGPETGWEAAPDVLQRRGAWNEGGPAGCRRRNCTTPLPRMGHRIHSGIQDRDSARPEGLYVQRGRDESVACGDPSGFMKILFLHGWQSVPGGVTPTYLAQHGHEVFNPKLPDEDFEEALRILPAPPGCRCRFAAGRTSAGVLAYRGKGVHGLTHRNTTVDGPATVRV